MRVLFPDTNFFFEFRKPIDLPWHELDDTESGKGPDIRLIVPPTVISEIERHKAKGNSRTAKRARQASVALRQALLSPQHTTELRSANPRITLELPPVVKVDFSQFETLDPTRPDHRIAAEFTEIRKIEPDLVVFSDDTLAILAVRSLGFEPILIPETWRLAPEKDERDDEIEGLRSELAVYKNSTPILSATILNQDEEKADEITGVVETFSLQEAELHQAVRSVQERSPIENDFRLTPPAGMLALNVGNIWRQPRKDEIEDYKTIDYPAWVESLFEKIPKVITRVNSIAREIPFSIRLINSGFSNATAVRLTITTFDGPMLLDGLNKEQASKRNNKICLPASPKPPKGRFISPTSIYDALTRRDFANVVGPLIPSKHDPNGFYYVDGRPTSPTDELVLTCDALPHQHDPYDLRFRIAAPEQNELGRQPRLRIRIHASNLRRPVEKYVTINLSLGRGDTLAKIASLEFDRE